MSEPDEFDPLDEEHIRAYEREERRRERWHMVAIGLAVIAIVIIVVSMVG